MVDYHENFYGLLEDAYNAGDSDRVVLRWDLGSDRAVRAAARADRGSAPERGPRRPPRRANGEPATGTSAAATCSSPGSPRTSSASARTTRSARPHGAGALRETVGRALADEFRAETITRDGWLVLRR